MIELYYFKAPWCVPCKNVGPMLHSIQGISLKEFDISTDDGAEMANAYDVYGLPTIIIMENNKPTDTIVGSTITKEKIEDCLKLLM